MDWRESDRHSIVIYGAFYDHPSSALATPSSWYRGTTARLRSMLEFVNFLYI